MCLKEVLTIQALGSFQWWINDLKLVFFSPSFLSSHLCMFVHFRIQSWFLLILHHIFCLCHFPPWQSLSYKYVVNLGKFQPLLLPCLIPLCLLIKSSFPLINTHASYSPLPPCMCDLWGLIRVAFVSLGIRLFTEAWSIYQLLHHWENEPLLHQPSTIGNSPACEDLVNLSPMQSGIVTGLNLCRPRGENHNCVSS